MHMQHLHTAVDTVSDGALLWPDFDRQEFRHGHPSAAGERRAAGVVQTWLPGHNAASGQRGTGESWAGQVLSVFHSPKTNNRETITLKHRDL